MEFITDALGSILGGGATGLFGTIATAFVSYKKIKEENRHKEQMAVVNQQTIRLEGELNLRQAQVEGEIQQSLADTKAAAEGLVASYEHDQRRYATGKLGKFGRFLMVLVDFARGSMRPGLTTYLVVLTTLMYVEMLTLVNGLQGALNGSNAVVLLQHIIMTVLYLTVTCVTWWFAGRQLEKYGVLRQIS